MCAAKLHPFTGSRLSYPMGTSSSLTLAGGMTLLLCLIRRAIASYIPSFPEFLPKDTSIVI